VRFDTQELETSTSRVQLSSAAVAGATATPISEAKVKSAVKKRLANSLVLNRLITLGRSFRSNCFSTNLVVDLLHHNDLFLTPEKNFRQQIEHPNLAVS
jgi:hypothetical protein